MNEQNPSANYGNDTTLQVVPGQGRNTAEQHALLRFDLSGISSSAEVESAILRLHSGQALTLYYQNDNPASGLATEVYTVTGTWDESTVTWNSKPTVASGDPLASFTPSSTSLVPYELDLTDLVQAPSAGLRTGWVGGTATNYGVVLKPASASDARSMTCISSENSSEAQRPALEVQLETGLFYLSYYHLGAQRIAMRVQEARATRSTGFPSSAGCSTARLSRIIASSTGEDTPG